MGTQLTVGDVFQAIEILPDDQQTEVRERLRKDGGVTPEYAVRIAELLDAQIQLEAGSVEGIGEEQRMLAAVSASMDRQERPVTLSTAEQEQALDEELEEQRTTYEQWLQDVDRIERGAAQRKEGVQQVQEQGDIAALRAMLLREKPDQLNN